MPRAVIGAALYLTVIGLFGLGLGAIVRNTAGGIAAFAGIMFVLPPLMNVLPPSWNHGGVAVPAAAGRRAVMALHHGNQLAPWTGFGVLCAYAAAALADRRRAAATPRRLTSGLRGGVCEQRRCVDHAQAHFLSGPSNLEPPAS